SRWSSHWQPIGRACWGVSAGAALLKPALRRGMRDATRRSRQRTHVAVLPRRPMSSAIFSARRSDRPEPPLQKVILDVDHRSDGRYLEATASSCAEHVVAFWRPKRAPERAWFRLDQPLSEGGRFSEARRDARSYRALNRLAGGSGSASRRR